METTPKAKAEETDWRDEVTWYTHETWFARLVKTIGGLYFRSVARVECIGLENLPDEGAGIMASNHINNLDVVYISLYSARFPHFMAKIELYKNPILAWGIRLSGSFPVYRGERDAWALRQAGQVLADNELLFMFPEGTRSGRKAQLRRGKIGVVKLALDNKVPVIPIAILGTQNFRFGPTARNHIRIEYGEPLDLVSMAGSPPYEYGLYRELTKLLMERIAAMLPPEHRGFYGKKVDKP